MLAAIIKAFIKKLNENTAIQAGSLFETPAEFVFPIKDVTHIAEKKQARKRVFGVGTALVISIVLVSIPWFMLNSMSINSIITSISDEVFVGAAPSQEFLTYTSSGKDISFQYPSDWPITTTPIQKLEDRNLGEIFNAQDETDGFLESIYLYEFDKDVSFEGQIDVIRKNLISNNFVITSEKDLLSKGVNTHVFEGTSTSSNGEKQYSARGMIYLFNSPKKYIFLEYVDQESTFDSTSQKFLKIIDSVSF